MIEAAKVYFSAAPEFLGKDFNDNYEYDLVDITRQALAEKGRMAYKEMQQALKRKDQKGFKKSSEEFLHLLLLQDSLLSTRKEFMVGSWLKRAIDLGKTQDEKNQYEWNARTQITTWGNRMAADQGGLHDYAHKEWAGILKDFYYHRWKLWIDAMMEELNGQPSQPLDFYSIEEPWTKQHNPYPSVAQGKAMEIIKNAIYKQ